jgi:hypothetical protein
MEKDEIKDCLEQVMVEVQKSRKIAVCFMSAANINIETLREIYRRLRFGCINDSK